MDDRKSKFEYRGVVSEDIPVLLKMEYEKYNPERISAELILLRSEENLQGRFQGNLRGDAYGNLRIQGENDSYPEVTIKDISGWSHQGDKANLFIGGFEYGISETPIENPGNIYVTVELTPSGILKKWGSRELHHDGSIKSTNGYPGEIEWNLDIGKGKAFTRYTYEEDSVFDNKATVQLERPSLEFEIRADSDLSTAEIKKEIEKEARDYCLLLSLCYRKLVGWYEIDFFIVPKNKDGRIVSPKIRKRVYSKAYPDHEDELVNHRDLVDEGLPSLVKNFRQSPIIESLRRSITFLASSQSNQTIEVNYFLSIISLESFCDGLIELDHEKAKIPAGKWERIEKTLRDSLNSLSGQQEMAEYIEAIKKKLPELKGITTLDKILYCCTTLAVEANDLWRKDGLEAGLNKALKMRNHLFHRAYCEDSYFLYANYVRLQVLTERLILKHLKWPDEKIWKWYDQKARRSQI